MKPALDALAGRTAWLRPALCCSIRWALKGPRWLPGRVRRAPLDVVVLLYRVSLWGLRHGV